MSETNFKTARGHEEPFAVQFSVFLANRIGQLKELTERFLVDDVRIVGLSIIDAADWAVVRMVASDDEKARKLLLSKGANFTESEVLLVELEDEQSLPMICTHLLAAEINVHFGYPLTIRSHDNPIMVFHVDDHVLSGQILRKHGFTLLGNQELGDKD
jgi:hypothetical protein